ncbi:hypothetical protein [Devosia yakushimensis]|nr:hypothetical protein [Devosia yakushimensis]
MSSWARPGAECVCIDDAWDMPAFYKVPHRLPMLNELLTVAAVQAKRGEVWLKFSEIPDDQSCDGQRSVDIWYISTSFRPIIKPTVEQDIALFKHHLDQVPAEQ